MKTCQDIALLHPVAVIGIQFDDRRADLEADLRDDTRFHGAETEDAHGHVLLGGNDRDGNGPDIEKQENRGGTRRQGNDREKITEQASCHASVLPRVSVTGVRAKPRICSSSRRLPSLTRPKVRPLTDHRRANPWTSPMTRKAASSGSRSSRNSPVPQASMMDWATRP